jgi:hypothetical protein
MTPTLTSTSTATPPPKVYHDDIIQDWFDTSGWSPDTSGTFTDTTLTQTKNQQRNRHTYYTDYLGNVSGDAYPSDYRTVSQTVYGTRPLNPVNHDDISRTWYDTSGWSPDPSGTFTDTTLTQYKNQAQDHSTYTTNDRGDRYNEGSYTETRTISQTVYGTKPLNPVNHDDVTRDWYDTSGWSPDASGTFTDTTLTQYKSQAQDHSTYTTNDRGDRYNEGTYTLTRTVDQVVYGTKPLNPVNHDDVTRDWYDTSGWSPDPSGTYEDETLTQYKSQAQDHSTYTTNDRGDRYNEGSYTATRTIDQVVYGTKPRCYTRTWYYTQSDNYDYSDPENPVYVSTTYDINTGDYTRCDGGTESFIVNITLDHPDDPGFYDHNACVRGSGSPSCDG